MKNFYSDVIMNGETVNLKCKAEKSSEVPIKLIKMYKRNGLTEVLNVSDTPPRKPESEKKEIGVPKRIVRKERTWTGTFH